MCIERNKIALLESPTGTGKSLSILSAAVSFILSSDGDEKSKNCEFDEFLNDTHFDRSAKRHKHDPGGYRVCEAVQDIETCLPDWVKEFEADNVRKPKIIYTSRTHSQLVQIVEEVKKLRSNKILKVVSLGSRKNLCINEDVFKLKSIASINNKCLDLIEDKNKPSCPFLKKSSEFGEKMLSSNKIFNMKEAKKLGEKMCACPYYGSKIAVEKASLITVPYNSIFHRPTRESLKLDDEGNILIVDEAHNLAEALYQMHSSTLSLKDMRESNKQIKRYLEKYKNRLKSESKEKLQNLLIILEKIENFIKFKIESFDQAKKTGIEKLLVSEKEQQIAVITINEFEFDSKLTEINLFSLVDFIREKEIYKKIKGFVEFSESENSFENFFSFLNSLTRNISEFGRVTVFKRNNTTVDKNKIINGGLRFWLLDVSSELTEVVLKAKSVLFIGGTLKPFDCFFDKLLHRVPKEKIEYYSCGHIVDDEQISVVTLKNGPTNKKFDFSYSKRENQENIKELGYTLVNYTNIIPGGIVAFFQSFAYLDLVLEMWKKAGILSRIDNKKKVFYEDLGKDTMETFRRYSEYISLENKGAILCCVYGGKLSEGIDFKDDLCRAIICIGLPFPNRNDMELKAKIDFYNSISTKSGDRFYFELCLRTVNQSIGRAIRWKNDYAFVLLIDVRYQNDDRITSGISEWMQKRLTHCQTFGLSIRMIKIFFSKMKDKFQRKN